ncbi:hypothetical protein, partial [Xanthovirga aplysinae]|uniref:hypothetical protein n=1 Tax=Xanthovirga aplysinae TaxID=2529853 RepID=UPI001656AC55
MYFLKKYRRGIKNKYYRGMPVTEMFLKDILFQVKEIKNFFKNGFKSKTILIYPHFPSRRAVIYKICNALNYNITNKLDNDFDLVLYYEYRTYRKDFEALEKLQGKKVVNLYSRNIGKEYVDEMHQKIFGYSTRLSPKEYVGPLVKKSLINAIHDGEVINGPIDKIEEGFIYQKLIDNGVEGNRVRDIRVPVINYEIPFIYYRYRNIDSRFKDIGESTMQQVNDELSDEEVKKILEFCRAINFEFGELDVLRDNQDGKIYIVDVNNTPNGPSYLRNEEEKANAVGQLS